jgi:hypothetical protein
VTGVNNWACKTSGCGHYIAEVAGGYDGLRDSLNQTRSCPKCGFVDDYHTHWRDQDTRKMVRVDSVPLCSDCGEKTVKWDLTCFKCGAVMKPLPGEIYTD